MCSPSSNGRKSDAADAKVICEAAQHPTMRFVSVKSVAKQASTVIFRTRDVLVGQRTQLINAIRGHLVEYGQIAPQGPARVERLIAQIEDPASELPPPARANLVVLVGALRHLQVLTAAFDSEIAAREGRRQGPAADDRTGHRPADRHCHRGPGPALRDVPLAPRL
ncbi:IS110 family transposase [Methylobacterium fujisawaense]|uniref:IS110 family transposase n=1 Tax=Methylobacterium fujisawaense TaxID=107400 RepID=UPI002F354CF3